MKYVQFFFLVFFLLLINCKAQQITNSQEQIAAYESQIIGTWISNNDPTYKRVFSNNNNEKTCKDYSNGVLTGIYSYIIGNSCENENVQGVVYLKLIDEDSDAYCFEINAINENNNHTLSLMGLMRGKIQLYTKQ